MYKRKVGALALSVALASAICVPTVAFAAEEWDPDVTYGTPSENVTAPDGDGTDTVLTGVIKPTTLSVSVPTAVTFSVDPGTNPSFTGAPGSATIGQFGNPSNYTITNKSRVPIYAAVTSVAAADCTLTDTFANLEAGTATNPKVMVALNDQKNNDGAGSTLLSVDATTSTQSTGWLPSTGLSATTPYYAFHQDNATTPNSITNGLLAAGKTSAGADVTDGTNAASMYVYGAVKGEGWNTGDKFTVTPTFTIKTVAFA